MDATWIIGPFVVMLVLGGILQYRSIKIHPEKHCPHYYEGMHYGEGYCGMCGVKLKAFPCCEQCGTQASYDKHCIKCGHKIKWV